MRERTKGLIKAILGTAVAFTLVFSVVSPAAADTTAGSGGGGGGSSGSSSWYWAYGDRPGDAWNAFVADWGSGVRAANGTIYSSNGSSTGANLSICQNAAQIWWIHFNNPSYAKFWGLDPGYLIRDSGGTGHSPSWWIDNLGLSGTARSARGIVPAGTTLSNGYTTASDAYFSDLVKSQAATYVANNTANNSSIVVVCSALTPAKVVVESGTQTKTITNGTTYDAPSSFTTVVQRQVLNTTSVSSTDNGVDLIGVNNLHDQSAAPIITNYGQIVAGIVGGTLFGSTPVNNLTRAQWTQIDTLINTAKTQDASLNHGLVTLDSANQQGLAEGGVLNVSEWAQRATIATSGSQTYTDYWRYTGVRYWNGSDWGAVQNISWSDTKLTTTPTWNTANGWTLASEQYSVTSSTPTQENSAFWQLISVHCNVDQLDAIKIALSSAGRAVTVIQQTNNDDGTITAILRTPVRNQGWADVPVNNATQQQAVNNAQTALTTAQSASTQAVTAYNAAVAARNTAQTNFNNAQTTYNNQLNAQGNVYPALITANDNLAASTSSYDNARTAALSSSVTLRQYVAGLSPTGGNGYTATTSTVSGLSNSNPVVDSSGNLYLRVGSNITKTTPAGATTNLLAISTSTYALAIDDQNRLYFVNAAGQLVRYDLVSLSSTNLGAVGSTVGGITVTSSYDVYYTNYSSNQVFLLPAGSTTSTLYNNAVTYPWGITIDSLGNILVSSYNGGGIYRLVSLNSIVLVAALASPAGITSAGGNIYVSQWSTGNVYLLNGATLDPVMASATTQVGVGASSYGLAVAFDGSIYLQASGSYKKFAIVNGIPAQEQTALVAASTAYESYYATNYVANPSNESSNAVIRANNAKASTANSTLVLYVDDFLTKNSNLAAAWTTYNNDIAAQATAQTNYNNAQTAVISYLTAMNNAEAALEVANDVVESASNLVATSSSAVTAAQEALTNAQQALTWSNGITQRVWSASRPTYLDFGDVLNPSTALSLSGYVGFYDKECVTDCTTSPTSVNATATNGANSNSSNSSNLGNKNSFGGAVLSDSTAREAGNVSADTNSNYLEIFRDNSTARTVHVNTAYPIVSGTNFNYNGSAPFTTTVNIWGSSTPDTNPASGQFFMTAVNITNRTGGGTSEVIFDGLNGSSVWTTDLTRAPATQKNFGNDLYSTGISETFSGFANTFQVGATWSSEKDRPVVLNIKWEYRPTTVVTVPSTFGFGTVLAGTDSSSQIRITQTQDLTQALDVRCYAQYGVSDSLDNNLGALTQQYTGTGSTNSIDTGLITTANGDDSYLENNNLVIKFIRGVSE